MSVMALDGFLHRRAALFGQRAGLQCQAIGILRALRDVLKDCESESMAAVISSTDAL